MHCEPFSLANIKQLSKTTRCGKEGLTGFPKSCSFLSCTEKLVETTPDSTMKNAMVSFPTNERFLSFHGTSLRYLSFI